MLTAERLEAIVALLAEQGSVTVPQLAGALVTSESTIRRDLSELARQGRLVKVHGGAVLPGTGGALVSKDDAVAERRGRNHSQKARIARAAAALVKPGGFVYIDSGTTTELLASLLEEPGAEYVTNSFTVAKALSARGLRCHLPGGRFKAATEALVGEGALEGLSAYNFSLGFFGANGVTRSEGFTTPEPGEAAVKRAAWRRCRCPVVLADGSKFGRVAPVGFAPFAEGRVITSGLEDTSFRGLSNITEV